MRRILVVGIAVAKHEITFQAEKYRRASANQQDSILLGEWRRRAGNSSTEQDAL